MMDIDPQDIPFIILFSFGCVHLLYFSIYYGRYSSLNQKLAKLVRMEKARVVAQASIDLTRNNTYYKIGRMRKWCYLPNAMILAVHWIFNMIYFGKQVDFSHFFRSTCVALCGSLLVLMGNYTKGAQIFDPNRRFFNRGRL